MRAYTKRRRGHIRSREKSEQTLTANRLINVRDIYNSLILTKDSHAVAVIRIYPVNIELLSENEIETMTDSLTAEFKGEKNPFWILSIPRAVDMEAYIDDLNRHYDEELFDPKRKMILSVMIQEATQKVMSGSNFEHQFFLGVWARLSQNSEKEINAIQERISDFEARYRTANIMAERLDDAELLRLCNLYANSNTALFETYEDNRQYTPITWMKERKKT